MRQVPSQAELDDGEGDRDYQGKSVDTPGPKRWRPDGSERCDHAVGCQQTWRAACVQPVLTEREDGATESHGKHRVNEQDPEAAVQHATFTRNQGGGPEPVKNRIYRYSLW